MMRVKQCKHFFLFLLDKNTTQKQIYYILQNPAEIHIQGIIELIHNLLENTFIKLTPSLKSKINQYGTILKSFTIISKTHLNQKRLLKKHFRLFYYLMRKSRNIISLAISQ